MKSRNFVLLFALICGFIFTLLGLPGTYAQEKTTEEFTLEEITVTAQTREENQQKVPITMNVITVEDIKGLGMNTIDEILISIPSAMVQKASDGYRVSLRGITDDATPINGQSVSTPTVAINTDGVYSNRKDNALSLYDIERVEVLYGPQSTQYGSNSPGGIINIITVQPNTDKFEGSGIIEIGNYSLLHTEGAVNVPLGDKIAIRAAFTTSKHNGYISNGTDDQNTKSGRIRALYQPSESFSITATAELTKNKSLGFGGGVEPFVYQDDVDDPWTASQSITDQVYSYNNQTSKKFYGQVRWDTFLGLLSMSPSYSTGKASKASILNDEVIHSNPNYRERGLEIRMVSPSDLYFKWILGFSYYKARDVLDMWQPSGFFTDRVMTNNNKAVYANITYPMPVITRLRLTLGYRKSWDEMITYNRELKPGFNASVIPQEQIQSNDGKPDWKYGFEYDLADSVMLYGDYSSSYCVQGMSMGGGYGRSTGPSAAGFILPQTAIFPSQEEANTTVIKEPPTTLHGYTLGVKSRFLGNKLQANASAYYYDYENYNANYMREVWLDENGDGVMNDRPHHDMNSYGYGDGTLYGFDLQTSTILTRKDMVTLSVSYIKSEWTKLKFNFDYPYGYKLDEDGRRIEIYFEDDYAGESMMNTPEYTFDLNYSHSFSLSNGGNLKASLSSKYKTAYRLSWLEDQYPLNYQEAYHVESASAVYSNPNGKWELSAYIKNIFKYAEKKMYMNIAGRGMMSIGDPRTYGIIFSVKF
ncbi:MAG: TonB-dependent receptor plug domain-containing protein [Deltaproteobacteria bacterium]|nr:TonB-dependent receptor plug domain-containing protein [Deltaproteobacteria bacterium]